MEVTQMVWANVTAIKYTKNAVYENDCIVI